MADHSRNYGDVREIVHLFLKSAIISYHFHDNSSEIKLLGII